MHILMRRQAIATKFDWHGVGGPTVWLSIDGMGNDRVPVIVTPDQMHELATGTRRVAVEIRCETELCYTRERMALDRALSESPPTPGSALELAMRFHEAYERLAPCFGYETKHETREFDPKTPNGRLMIAVCREIIEQNARSHAGREKGLHAATCGRCGEVVTYTNYYRHTCKANAPDQARVLRSPEAGCSASLVAQPPRDVSKLYHELLYAVARKFPGESRHETALRYIRDTERRVGEEGSCKQNKEVRV